jgi:spore germination protein GerM
LFQKDLLCDRIEVQVRIAVIILAEPVDLGQNDINSLVRQIFSIVATAAGKDPNEPVSDLFISRAGFIAVGIKPAQ